MSKTIGRKLARVETTNTEPSDKTVKVSAKGWVVIPIELRRRYGIEPGQEMRIVDYGGVLSLVPPLADPVRQGRGMLRGGASLSRALLEERRREREREAR